MTDILSEITPLSRGIIWLRKEEVVNFSPIYKMVDYLLDGLLTAKMNAHSTSPTGLLVGKNFGKDFYVFLSSSETAINEVSSFYTLLSPLLSSDEDILVLDETDSYANLLKITPEDIKKRFRVIK
jgi:hypothetical protein